MMFRQSSREAGMIAPKPRPLAWATSFAEKDPYLSASSSERSSRASFWTFPPSRVTSPGLRSSFFRIALKPTEWKVLARTPLSSRPVRSSSFLIFSRSSAAIGALKANICTVPRNRGRSWTIVVDLPEPATASTTAEPRPVRAKSKMRSWSADGTNLPTGASQVTDQFLDGERHVVDLGIVLKREVLDTGHQVIDQLQASV